MAHDDWELALRWAFHEGHFVLRVHAHQKLLIEERSVDDLQAAGAKCEVLEDYPEREHGHAQLVLGMTNTGSPMHIVVDVAAFEEDPTEPLVVVTVYRPEPPEWLDERTRGKR